MLMLKETIDRHGVPMALYSDRHGIFQRSSREPESLAEQLRGRPDPTQFARALEELDIHLILAHTPQAKGRVERAWGTFQDRLVSELRLACASTIEEARAIASKLSDMVQLRSTTVATVTGMGWIVSRARSRLRIPENTAFQRCFTPDYDHVFRAVGFRCDCPVEEANRVLWDFLPRYNEQFGVAPAQLGSAYRPLPAGVSLNETLCFKYLRTVANDNTVSFNGSTLQLLADGHRASYARALVEVQERLDGSIVVAYQGRTLAVEPAPDGPVQIRARSGRRSNGRLPADDALSGSNGAHSRPVGAERRNGAKSLQGVRPLPTPKTKTGSPWKPAPDHPWRRTRLT